MEMSSSRRSSARMKSGVSVIARKQAKVEAARAKIKISEQERNQIKLDEDDLWASMLRHELSVVSESCDLRTHNVFTQKGFFVRKTNNFLEETEAYLSQKRTFTKSWMNLVLDQQKNERKSEQAHIPHAPTLLENAVYNEWQFQALPVVTGNRTKKGI